MRALLSVLVDGAWTSLEGSSVERGSDESAISGRVDQAVAADGDEREAGRQKAMEPCGKEGIRVEGTVGVRQ